MKESQEGKEETEKAERSRGREEERTDFCARTNGARNSPPVRDRA